MNESYKAVYDFYRQCVGTSKAKADKYAKLHCALKSDIEKRNERTSKK